MCYYHCMWDGGINSISSISMTIVGRPRQLKDSYHSKWGSHTYFSKIRSTMKWRWPKNMCGWTTPYNFIMVNLPGLTNSSGHTTDQLQSSRFYPESQYDKIYSSHRVYQVSEAPLCSSMPKDPPRYFYFFIHRLFSHFYLTGVSSLQRVLMHKPLGPSLFQMTCAKLTVWCII